jgi:hypothetical protein
MIRILCRAAQDAAMTELAADQLASALKVKRNLTWVDLSGERHGLYRPLLTDLWLSSASSG